MRFQPKRPAAINRYYLVSPVAVEEPPVERGDASFRQRQILAVQITNRKWFGHGNALQ